MAVTVRFLYSKSVHIYRMQYLAGQAGFDRTVTWIHMIESKEAASFLQGGELVFFTGLLCENSEWLMDYATQLHQGGAAGLVVNIGSYIKEIPDEVSQFCEGAGLPLFILPWDVRLVDITRYLCQFIMEEEKKEQRLLQYFVSIIMAPDHCGPACAALEQQGIDISGTFCVSVLKAASEKQDTDEILALLGLLEKVYAIPYGGAIAGILFGDEAAALDKVKEIYTYLLSHGIAVTISVGDAVSPISKLSESYRKAAAIQALTGPERPVAAYRDAGLYKLLLNGTPVSVLQDFYEETLGALAAYDKAHRSSLTETLRYYLFHQCSIKETALHEVVHRNTILYKFNKIEKITGKDLYDEEDKTAMVLAFKIRDLLYKK